MLQRYQLDCARRSLTEILTNYAPHRSLLSAADARIVKVEVVACERRCLLRKRQRRSDRRYESLLFRTTNTYQLRTRYNVSHRQYVSFRSYSFFDQWYLPFQRVNVVGLRVSILYTWIINYVLCVLQLFRLLYASLFSLTYFMHPLGLSNHLSGVCLPPCVSYPMFSYVSAYLSMYQYNGAPWICLRNDGLWIVCDIVNNASSILLPFVKLDLQLKIFFYFLNLYQVLWLYQHNFCGFSCYDVIKVTCPSKFFVCLKDSLSFPSITFSPKSRTTEEKITW